MFKSFFMLPKIWEHNILASCGLGILLCCVKILTLHIFFPIQPMNLQVFPNCDDLASYFKAIHKLKPKT